MYNYIIMADIINSSDMPGKLLMNHFKDEVDSVNQKFTEKIISPLTITLGDEFQGIVKDLASAVEVIFYIDQRLLKNDLEFHLRYVVNYGVIDTAINSRNAYEMLGEGLTRARELLAEIKASENEILMAGIAEPTNAMLNMAFKLYRSLYNDWKKEDRAIAALFLEVEDYKIVANSFQRDPSTMWRRERSLKMNEFKTSRNLITALADA